MKIKEGKQIGFVIKKGINVDKQFQYGKCIFEQGFDSANVGVSEVTLNGTIGKNLKSYTIKGNTVQNGTPTPDNPVEVLGVGDKTGNLLDFEQLKNAPSGTIGGSTYCTHVLYLHLKSYTYYTMMSDGTGSIDSTPADLYRSVYFNSTNGGASVNKNNPVTVHTDNTGIVYVAFFDERTNAQQYLNGVAHLWINEANTPLPYEPYGYKMPMLTMGSNLYNINDETNRRHLWHNSMHYVYDPDRTLIFIPCEGAETYTLYNFYNPSVTWSISQSQYIPEDGISYDIDGKSTFVSLTGIGHYTLTTNAKVKYIAVSVGNISSIESFFGKLMICKSNYKSSPYEPYQEPYVSNVYLDEPLYSGDYIKLNADGSGVVHREWEKLVLTGEDGEWERSPTRTGSFYLALEKTAITGLGRCDRAVNASELYVYSSPGKIFIENTGSPPRSLLNVWLFDTDISRTDFKAFLAEQYAAGTPVTVYYQLATPTDTPITLPDIPTLRALPPLHTYDGATTVLSVDTTVSPSKFDAAYKSNVSNPYKIEYHTADNIGFASADGAVFTTRY